MNDPKHIIQYNDKNHYLRTLLIDSGKLEDYNAILLRIKRGWNIQRAINRPVNKHPPRVQRIE